MLNWRDENCIFKSLKNKWFAVLKALPPLEQIQTINPWQHLCCAKHHQLESLSRRNFQNRNDLEGGKEGFHIN